MARASVSLFAQQKFDSAQDDRQGFYFAIIHSYQCKFETNTLTKHHKYSIMFHVIARVTSSLFTLTYYLIRGYGGIGRRARFRILCSFVQVRPLLPAPKERGATAPLCYNLFIKSSHRPLRGLWELYLCRAKGGSPQAFPSGGRWQPKADGEAP